MTLQIRFYLIIRRFVFISGILLFSSSSLAAIVNNNHLYQKVQQIALQVQAIRAQQQLPTLEPEPQIVADKLASHLVFKTQQIGRLAAALQQKMSLPITSSLAVAYSVMRPRNVLPYLDQVEQQLAAVAKHLALPEGPELERPLGMTENDVYQQLVVIEQLFEGLIEPQTVSAMSADLALIRGDLQLISEAKNLPLQLGSLGQYHDRQMTDVNILAYQSLYLIERLFRQLDIEPSKPDRLPVGESSIEAVRDTTILIRAELHRGKTILKIEQDSQVMDPLLLSDANQSYAAFIQLRDGLLSMLGAPAL
ncbi:hypothetical protein ACRRS0_06925 [Agarivorans sp. QJM3NY_29]|uniref:hypothetical protein n=1 Tax=unclassified Agarivorans TaxID=2636026 RepID=UPI003D7D451E